MRKPLLFVLLIAACSSDTEQPAFTPPASGTLIATDSMAIVEDELNKQSFSVAVYATDSSINGTYDIDASWGFATANSSIRLPHGGEHFTPILRKGTAPYTYIIGFHFDNDTVFRDYYQVSGERGQISMKYIKAYSL